MSEEPDISKVPKSAQFLPDELSIIQSMEKFSFKNDSIEIEPEVMEQIEPEKQLELVEQLEPMKQLELVEQLEPIKQLELVDQLESVELFWVTRIRIRNTGQKSVPLLLVQDGCITSVYFLVQQSV